MRKSWKEWWDAFGADLISVIPHDADSDTIAKHLRGKVPGTKKANGKWIGTVGSMVDRQMTLAEAKQAARDGAVIGMNARDQLGLDIDVSDPVLAGKIVAHAKKVLGPAPVRTREGSARCLLMYAGNGAYIRKMRLAFRCEGVDEDTAEKPDAVELLGSGQYYNCEGVHPSGQPYQWNPHPVDLGPFGLTVVTDETLRAFFDSLPELFGLKVVQRTGNVIKLTTSHRTSLTDPSKRAPSPQLVIELLKTWRPDSMGHDEFVQTTAAIKAALGPTCEDFYSEFFEWAPGVRSTETEATRKVWDSLDDTTAVGWNWLVDKSGDPGGVVAAADYDTPPDETKMPIDPKTAALDAIIDQWVFETSDGLFFHLEKGIARTERLFNAMNTKLNPYGSHGRQTPAAMFLNDPRTVKVDTVTYRPGRPQLLEEEQAGVKLKAFNMWRPPLLKPRRNIRPDLYIEHAKLVIPEEESRNHFFDFMAFCLQRPGVKINHALVLFSTVQGVGKDTLLAPLIHGVGVHNVSAITPESLNDQYTYYLKSQIIICNEMANFEKKSVYNKLKPFLAAPPEWLTLYQKFLKPTLIPNIQNWIFSTNYANAVSLDDADRRFYIYECQMNEPPPPQHFDRIYKYFEDGGYEIIVGWYLDRDISSFDPTKPPPETDAKREMAYLAKPLAVRWLDEQFEEGGRFCATELVTAGEIFEVGNDFGSPQFVSQQMHSGHIITALKKNGFVRIPGRHRIDGKVTTVWTRNKRLMNLSGEFLAEKLRADRRKR